MTLIERTAKRIRLLQLLEAAETAAIAPVSISKLHSLAYLADVLSPVWGLDAFDKALLKTHRAPYYPDLQYELDLLVAMGLAEVFEPMYLKGSGERGIEFTAKFGLRFASSHGVEIRDALKSDPDLLGVQSYLNELAAALASLPDDEISSAATEDDTYRDTEPGEVVYVARDATDRTRTTAAAFDSMFPGVPMSPSRRLYMYAQYLGQCVADQGLRANG